MIVPVSPAAREFYRGIAAAYQRSPLEVIAVISFFAVIIGGSMIYVFIQQRRRRAARLKAAQRVFQEHLDRLRLIPSQIDLLEVLSQYLPEPWQKHRLIEDEVTFTGCARRALEAGNANSDAISALRVALGFRRDADRAPHSSTQLRPGTTVFIVRERRTPPVRAQVLSQEAHGFRVEVKSDQQHFPTAGSVAVYYHSAAGVFRINTMVRGVDGAVLDLRHSEALTRTQQRRHFRRRLKLPVRVRPLDTQVEPEATRFHDLGGGGASIVNPEGRFQPGDHLELRFSTDAGRTPLQATARVLRCSHGDRVAHLEFVTIHEFVRDRIYRLLFSRAR